MKIFNIMEEKIKFEINFNYTLIQHIHLLAEKEILSFEVALRLCNFILEKLHKLQEIPKEIIKEIPKKKTNKKKIKDL